MVADYKAGRAEAPKDLPPQFEMIREVMHALAIPVVEAPGYEADDVLATLATEARDRGCDVVVVTAIATASNSLRIHTSACSTTGGA